MGDGGSGEKTEEPTPERLRKLREDGNVPKSQDVILAASFLAVFCVLAASMSFIADEIKALTTLSFHAAFTADDPFVAIVRLLFASLLTMGKVCAPVLATAMVIGFAANVAQVGFLFSAKPVTPNFEKLNPVNGFKNMFNMKKVVELLKTIIKFIVVGWLAWIALRDSIRDLAMLIRSDLGVSVKVVGGIIWDFTTKIGGAFFGIAAFDYFYEHRRYMKDNMMSQYDVKQEYKQSEGDPHYKSERRRTHQEILNSAGPSNVKKADVVVRNPDHIAIALQYNKEAGSAPTVVAKGNRIWAEKILDAARRYGVPVVRNVPLAHALDKLEVGDEIPEELYEAVAEVLNFVYQLAEEQKRKGGKGGKDKGNEQEQPKQLPMKSAKDKNAKKR